MTGPVFSLRELSTELKNTDFHFQSLVKTTWLLSKTLHKHLTYIYIYIYMRIVKKFLLGFMIFEIIFIFSFWNKNFKRIGCVKARFLYIDRVEITSDKSGRSQMFLKTGDLKNSAIFTRKYLYWSLFLKNLL